MKSVAERLAVYEGRGFSSETAAILVLIEETLHALFSVFPDTFVLFGGATLVLFYGSQRHSADIDLLVDSEQPPNPDEITKAILPPLREVAAILGLEQISIEPIISADNFQKLNVFLPVQGKVLFTIDIGSVSAIIKSELVEQNVLSEEARIKYPTRNLLLLHKAEAFLGRKNVKCRDAFDIKMLIDSGAELDDNLKSHLQDGPAAEHLEDVEFIRKRIASVTSARCTNELQPFLPKEVFDSLEEEGFEPLRESLRNLFSEWLTND